MAGEIIRPKDLTPRPAPVASELMVVDNSVNVGAATIKAIVEAGRPAASQAEAQAGTDPSKAMTPLTTKQSIAAEVGVSLASKSQGDLAATAVQPESLATVATSGAYGDLSGKPVLGTSAATDASAYATSTQGGKADTALQSVVPGANVAIDNTDPRNPVVSASSGGGLGVAEDRAALKGMNTAAVTTVYLKETGREGQFVWKTGDYSSQIATDTLEGIFVKATATAATAGAWVRQFDGPVHARWFGASLQIAVNVAAMLGKSLYLGGKGTTHTITSTLAIPADLMVYSQLFGGAGAKIDASSGNFKALSLGAGATLAGIEVEGPGNTVFNASSIGISAEGSVGSGGSAPNYLENITIRNCEVHGFNFAGIYLQFVSGFEVSFSQINENSYVGLGTLSSRNGVVRFVNVADVSPGNDGNAYGMFFSRASVDSIVQAPRSEHIRIQNCTVRDVAVWHGFDTHGGSFIDFEDCTAYNCGRAFVITFSSDTGGGKFASKSSGFRRCKALEPAPNLSQRGEAFWVIGAVNGSTTTDYADGCYIEDCYVDGYGFERLSGSEPLFPGSSLSAGSASTRGCVEISRTKNLRVRGNIFKEAVGNVFYVGTDNQDFEVSSNRAWDWISARGNSAFFDVTASTQTGFITNNSILVKNGALATYTAKISYRSAGSLTGLGIGTKDNRLAVGTGSVQATAYGTYFTE